MSNRILFQTTYALLFSIVSPLFSTLLAQNIYINEVVASNSVLEDTRGNKPDWIELYNPSNSPIDLTGFGIADTNDISSVWTFPGGTIPAKGHFLLFASNDDMTEIVGYESISRQGDTWKYLIPDANTSSDWFLTDFDDTNWAEGPTGIGYGAGDDATVTPEDLDAIYARKTFQLDELSTIREAFLHIDYDDAFVAYLNGVEVARANIGEPGVIHRYSDKAILYHNPIIITGLPLEVFPISAYTNLLVEGDNVFAIGVYNKFRTSTEGLSLIPFLTLGRAGAGFLPDTLGDFLDLSPNLYHTDFKISSSGESVYLFRPDGQLEDSLGFPYLLPNVSVGRTEDGASEKVFFTTPTPGAENGGEQFVGLIEDAITFSHATGSYEQAMSLSLSHKNADNLLTYTTDGSLPTPLSPAYSGPISIDSTMVIRANLFREGYLSRDAFNKTFLINDPSKLATVSLISDSVNLFSEEFGLFASGPNADSVYPYFGSNFWQDWERPAFFSLLDKHGELEYESNAGMKISGNFSRGRLQKSFSLFARKQYGTSTFEHRFFPIRPYDEFESILMRNTGSDWARGRLRDLIVTGLMKGSAVDFQAYVPARLFINGHYWGTMNMREKISEHLVASLHDVDPDGVTLLKSNSVPINGSSVAYEQFTQELESRTMQTEEDMAFLLDHVDLDNFLQYNIAQVFSDNRDWPNNNLKYWKAQNGKWRWILFDTDFAFGLRDIENYTYNTLDFALEEDGPSHPNPPWATLLFRKTMENETFRHQFINQYADDLNTRFLSDAVRLHIDTLLEAVTDETIRHLNRWGEDIPNWEEHVERMKVFAAERPAYARQHIMEQFQLASMQTIHTELAQPDLGYIQLNSLELRDSTWSGIYFEGVPVQLTAIAKPGYRFDKWTGDISSLEDPTDRKISIDLTVETRLRAHFIESFYEDLGIVINEINYNSSNEADSEDWIELTNISDQTVDLSDWIFKDGDDDHAFVLPEDTYLEPDSFLVLCREMEAFDQVLPAVSNRIGAFDFGLSRNGDNLRLYDAYGYLQDQVYYYATAPWPTEPDGTGATLSLLDPKKDNAQASSWEHNITLGTPGKKNEKKFLPLSDTTSSLVIYPNPVEDELRVVLRDVEDAEVTIRVCTPYGQVVMTQLSRLDARPERRFTLDVGQLQPGWYYLQVFGESFLKGASFLKE